MRRSSADPSSISGLRATADSRVCENSRPMADPICATSLAGPSRSAAPSTMRAGWPGRPMLAMERRRWSAGRQARAGPARRSARPRRHAGRSRRRPARSGRRRDAEAGWPRQRRPGPVGQAGRPERRRRPRPAARLPGGRPERARRSGCARRTGRAGPGGFGPRRPQRLQYQAPSIDGGAHVETSTGPGVRDDFAHVGRNDPCPCGSGRKYKRCHGDPRTRPDA